MLRVCGNVGYEGVNGSMVRAYKVRREGICSYRVQGCEVTMVM